MQRFEIKSYPNKTQIVKSAKQSKMMPFNTRP